MKCMGMNKTLNHMVAISLIVISFLLYAIMPFNTYLPFSACVIAGITGSMVVISEIIFWIGSLMLGRDIALKIRKKFSIMGIINHLRERRKGK